MTNDAWHALSGEEALERLGSSPRGLDEEEAQRRLRRDGPNRLTARKGRSALQRLLDQVLQPLIIVLVVAALIAAALGDLVDAAVIAAVVVVNAAIGYLQETRAENAIAALDALVETQATVLRGGAPRRVPGADLVVGDVVLLASGDAVPADLRLLTARDLQVEEAALTGESVPVPKHTAAVPEETPLTDRHDLAFAGTAVTYGRATGVVVATGDATESGHIAEMISTAEGVMTPLTRRLTGLSRLLLWVILLVAAGMFALEAARGRPHGETFSAVVAFAVGAIPEGLPAGVSVLLAVGVSKRAARGAIMRRLPAVETLGSTTVVCSDKTGTLTENQLTVTRVWTGEAPIEVTGAGYEPAGELLREGAPVDLQAEAGLLECLRCAALCQDTRLRREGDSVEVEGDPTEAALIVLAEKGGLTAEALARWPRLDTLPFESEHMYMATLHDGPQGPALYVKGSTEAVLARCADALGRDGRTAPLDRAAAERALVSLAEQGLRVLCLARRDWTKDEAVVAHQDVQGLTLIGLVGAIDPPRPAARGAVATCHRAGVQVKMITGDHAITAAAIARELCLEGERDAEGRLEVLTGAELAELPEERLPALVEGVSVFARVAPEQKLAIVRALQRRRHVVAMTGDGVNDAPALKQADIGVAMGRGGTDVARGAAAMVLTDDDFATIEAAIEEGRGVYDNLVKFVTWTLPTNGGEGLVILAALAVGAALPILPVQILWINMATAIFLGTTLVFEPKEPGIMDRPPKRVDSPLVGKQTAARIVIVSALIAVAAFGLFKLALAGAPEQVAEARTVAGNTIVVVEVAYLFACRSLTLPLWRLGLFSNPWVWAGAAAMLALQLAWTYLPVMNRLFHTAPLAWTWWLVLAGAGLAVFAVVEAKKVVGERLRRRREADRPGGPSSPRRGGARHREEERAAPPLTR